MTIAEKLLRAKTDYDEVADASYLRGESDGYAAGVSAVKTEEAKSSDDLTASGATVTVPAGYYAEDAEKSVATVTQATPIISVNSSGLITASVTQTEGYVSEGTKSATKQLAIQSASTVTPSSGGDKIAVYSGRYTTGAVVVPGEPNMIPQNIKSGVSIYGVEGNFDNYELGRKKWIPLAAQSGKPTTAWGANGDFMYSPDVFEGDATEQFTLETIPYSLSDWVQVAVAASESTSCIISASNAHRSLYFILYIRADVELDADWGSDYDTGKIVIPPDSTASCEFGAHDHESQTYNWTYTIKGVRVSKDGT